MSLAISTARGDGLGRHLRGHDRAGEDMVAMLVLAEVEGRETAVDAARRDDRDLALEGDEAFEDRAAPRRSRARRPGGPSPA